MPVSPTHPGVYIAEIPSGVRTITGVATSITAFVGRAKRGPVNEPVSITSYADFERLFGGLWVDSAMSYAVRDFYLNGGSQAIIVRLYHPDSDPSKAQLRLDSLTLEAASEGAWGNALLARVDHEVSPDVAERYELEEADLFNLMIMDRITGKVEQFRNVTVKPSSRQVDKVLENESSLVRLFGSPPKERPEKSDAELTGEVKQGAKEKATEEQKKKAELAKEELKKPPFTVDRRCKSPKPKASDGKCLDEADFKESEDKKEGIYALEKADLFNLLCIPPYKNGNEGVDADVLEKAGTYCEKRRALLLIDSPSKWKDKETAKKKTDLGTTSKNAAVFFPRLRQPNPLKDDQMEDFAPCGAVAGVFARTDAQRGVWKAPAGLDATLAGVPQLSVPLTDAENGELNPLGINCLRILPAVGPVVWGARTLQGDDRLASEWKYIPVRRLTLYIEESLYRGTQWVVFEPNDEPLWSQIRLNLGSFMHGLFRQGAFQGKTPREAYFVKCDRETTTQDDINRGIVNIVVGFAPLKPAEFVIIKIQQMAGQIAT